MFFDGPAERNRVHARIDELERRLAALEQSRDDADQDAPATDAEGDRRHPSEQRFGRRVTDQLVRSSPLDQGEPGSEGARLVAIDMLEAGYEPEQVASYLRETFHLDEEGAALAVTGTPPD
jgi:hypothetical protein